MWSALDGDRDDRLTVGELLDALGPRGLELLAGEAGDPIPRRFWNGSEGAFDALDDNGDGYVDQNEIHCGLGRAATRLLLNGEPPGPELSPGARYERHGGGLWVVFPGREAKAAYMTEAAARDASDPEVLSWAQQFMKLPPEQRAAAILRFCQLAVRYQRDPAWYDRAGNRHGIEVLDSSAVVLFRGYGDCDAKTRLFLALCKACSVPARLAPVFRGVDGFPHVRAEVLDDKTGRWLIADPSIANSSIGHLPPHNRTHILQRRLTSRGWEVSDDDGNTWHPMEGGHEAGDDEAAPDDTTPGDAMPGDGVPGGPMPGGAVPGEPSPGDRVPSGPMPGDASRNAQPPRRATFSAPKPIVRTSRRPRAHGGPRTGPYIPGAIVYIGGNWYRIDRHGRATPEGILPNQPPPPPPDQVAAQLAAARRVPHMPPPRRPARPHPAPLAHSAAAPAPPGSMLPSQVPQIIAAVPQVISAVGQGISGVTSAVQSIASAFSGFGGGVGEAGSMESETAIPGINAIVSALGSMAFRLEDLVANSHGQVHPTPEQADSWLRAFRIDPGLLFSASHASAEAAARLVRYLKLASGEQPMQPGWRLGSNPYLTHVDPTDPLTDPVYLEAIRDAIVGTSDPRSAVKHLALQPVVVTRETARRMLALLRHELVANGLPHWSEARANLGEIAREISRLRHIAGEAGADPYLSRLFGDVSLPVGQSAA